MCAAKADFRPKQISQQKIKKIERLCKIDLEPTEDLGEIAGIRSVCRIHGFSDLLPSQDLIKISEKLKKRSGYDDCK